MTLKELFASWTDPLFNYLGLGTNVGVDSPEFMESQNQKKTMLTVGILVLAYLNRRKLKRIFR